MMKAYHTFCIIFSAVLLLVFGYSITTKIYFSVISKSWGETQAKVVKIDNSNPKSAELFYEYSYQDRTIRGNNLAYLSKGTIPDKHYINDNYKKGQLITIFVNSNNPNQSVVLKRKIHIKYMWIYILIVGFCMLWIIYASNQIKKSNKALQPTAKSGG